MDRHPGDKCAEGCTDFVVGGCLAIHFSQGSISDGVHACNDGDVMSIL